MHSLSTKAVVTKPDGTLFYREEHEWANLSPEMLSWFQSQMTDAASKAKAEHGGKDDDANLTIVLSAVIDGSPIPDVSVSGVSYKGLTRLERAAHHIGDQLIKKGEAKAAKAHK